MQIKYPRRTEQPTETQAKPQRFGLCDPNWEYVPAASTDVTKTWRKHGWTPTNEKEINDE